MADIKAGDNIIWKLPDKGDTLASVLSRILAWKDPSWKARSWKGWHEGYIVKVLDTGEIVTSQAVNAKEGVCAVTYSDVAAMGDCKIYHWLDNSDQVKIDQYAAEHNGDKYDVMAYVWTIITYLFNLKFAIINNKETCWENVSQFDRCMGKELQPEDEMPLISKMMNKLEGVK